VLEHRKPDAGGPLNEGVVGVEVEEVAVFTSSGDTEDIL
jgi:hypothetical protein